MAASFRNVLRGIIKEKDRFCERSDASGLIKKYRVLRQFFLKEDCLVAALTFVDFCEGRIREITFVNRVTRLKEARRQRKNKDA